MSIPEGARAGLKDLLRGFGEAEIVRRAEEAGLSPRAHRMRCPFQGCNDQGKDRARNVALFAGDIPRLRCHRCAGGGTLVDLVMALERRSEAEAIALIRGLPATRPPPPVLLRPPRPVEEDRLSAQDVTRLWEGMAQEDAGGQRYLEGRGLDDAGELRLVRFATEEHQDRKRVASLARRGYRVAALMSDVTGNPRGIQVRLARDARAKEPKIMSVKGSSSSRSFFGDPGAIESAWLVCVAEGLADTLALAIWASGSGAVVVGAGGKDSLHRLAEELEAAAIPVAGKTFALFVQNDAPKNFSRREFVRLSQLLSQREAHVVLVGVDAEFKDLAEWRAARPQAPWPPPELARALLPPADGDAPAEARAVTPAGTSVPIPAQVRAEYYAQDFTTLCALLDDPVHREAIMGRGELSYSEMVGEPLFNGKELAETDLFAVRLGLEGQGRSTDGKPLKFSVEDIDAALRMLARRKTVHPVRDWLASLKWDGTGRLDIELPAALGQREGGLAGTLLSRWMLSAVARAMEPGCKVDAVLVLVGPQAAGKSRFCAALGGEWFTDSPVNVGDPDGMMLMRRSWIVEWAELDAMRRARDQEAIKAFLSSATDHFRPKFGRKHIRAPRHCVIVGTTNNREFLHDPTGNRRFWPVEVSKIDVAWVRTHREQLFAEAVHLFHEARVCPECAPLLPEERCARHRWWLSAGGDDELAEANQEHEVRDVWADLIGDWVRTKAAISEVTTGQVLAEAICMPAHQWSPVHQGRVGKVLKDLGWRRVRRRVGDRTEGRTQWAYARE